MSRPVKIRKGEYEMTAYGNDSKPYILRRINERRWHISQNNSLVAATTTFKSAEDIVNSMNARDKRANNEDIHHLDQAVGLSQFPPPKESP